MEKDRGRRFLSSGLSRPFYRELKTPDKGSIEALAYLHFRNKRKWVLVYQSLKSLPRSSEHIKRSDKTKASQPSLTYLYNIDVLYKSRTLQLSYQYRSMPQNPNKEIMCFNTWLFKNKPVFGSQKWSVRVRGCEDVKCTLPRGTTALCNNFHEWRQRLGTKCFSN